MRRTADKDPCQDAYRPSGAEAIRLLEIIDQCQGCRSQSDFKALFPKVQDLLPADTFLALLGRLDGQAALAVDGVNVSFPEDWIRAYVASDSLARDAVVRKTFLTQEAQYWCDAKVRLPEPNALSLCRDFGLRCGCVAGVGPLLAEKKSSLFCFCGQEPLTDKRCGFMLRRLLPHLHLALHLTLGQSSPIAPKVSLSRREQEVLHWLKEGKSSWDISVILGIGERTVNFHVYNVMDKLKTSNRAQTVAVALHHGLLDAD